MAELMYGVMDNCNFRCDIVSVAMAYLDLLLPKGSDFISTKRSFQLGVITYLSLAKKVFDAAFVKLSSLVRLGRGSLQIYQYYPQSMIAYAALGIAWMASMSPHSQHRGKDNHGIDATVSVRHSHPEIAS